MRIKIRTEDVHLFLPVPAIMIGWVVRMLPERLFAEVRVHTPQPYDCLITKEYIASVLTECMELLRENRGLEVVHVEASDGTFVSIRL